MLPTQFERWVHVGGHGSTHVTIEGTIVQNFDLHYTKAGVSVVSPWLGFTETFRGEKTLSVIMLKLFAGAAERAMRTICKGSHVVVWGRLRGAFVIRDGERHLEHYVLVEGLNSRTPDPAAGHPLSEQAFMPPHEERDPADTIDLSG